MTILVFGLGYTLQYWHQQFPPSSTLWATQRNPKHNPSVHLTAWNQNQDLPQEIKNHWPKIQHIIFSIPPDTEGDPAIRAIIKAGLSCNHIQSLIYLSATSVYGNHQGAWVDENSAYINPSLNGRKRLLAEQQIQNLSCTFTILRLSGIYGPGRLKIWDNLRNKIPLIHQSENITNRIFVGDIAQVIHKLLEHPKAGENKIYNLSDLSPSCSWDIATYISEKYKLPAPVKKSLNETQNFPEFYQESKKVSSERIWNDLNLKPLAPSFKEGLKLILGY